MCAYQMKPNECVVENARLSYAYIWEPRQNPSGEDEWSVSLLIPKSETATVAKIEMAIDAALQENAKVFGGKIPPTNALRMPLRDGDLDRPNDPAYANHYFMTAKSKKRAPGIVDRTGRPIPLTEKDTVYSGCYANVFVNFYPYNRNGNRGVSCGLGFIMKTADGEPFAGGPSVLDAFANYLQPEAQNEGGEDYSFLGQ